MFIRRISLEWTVQRVLYLVLPALKSRMRKFLQWNHSESLIYVLCSNGVSELIFDIK